MTIIPVITTATASWSISSSKNNSCSSNANWREKVRPTMVRDCNVYNRIIDNVLCKPLRKPCLHILVGHAALFVVPHRPTDHTTPASQTHTHKILRHARVRSKLCEGQIDTDKSTEARGAQSAQPLGRRISSSVQPIFGVCVCVRVYEYVHVREHVLMCVLPTQPQKQQRPQIEALSSGRARKGKSCIAHSSFRSVPRDSPSIHRSHQQPVWSSHASHVPCCSVRCLLL